MHTTYCCFWILLVCHGISSYTISSKHFFKKKEITGYGLDLSCLSCNILTSHLTLQPPPTPCQASYPEGGGITTCNHFLHEQKVLGLSSDTSIWVMSTWLPSAVQWQPVQRLYATTGISAFAYVLLTWRRQVP